MAGRLTGCLLLAVAGSALAAPFADPTRPPSASAAGAAAVSTGPRLESVLVSPARRVAVIDGKEYRAGEAFGDGRILSIAPAGVAIQRGSQTEILRLYPEYTKRAEKRTK